MLAAMRHVITESELIEFEESVGEGGGLGLYESRLAVEALRGQHEEINRLHAGISQLAEIIVGMRSGHVHDSNEIEFIKTTYPLAFDLLVINGVIR